MLKVTFGGSYKTGDGSLVNYENQVVMIPDCNEDYVKSAVINRMLPIHFEKAEEKFVSNNKCWIDKIEKVKDNKVSCCGKSIKELNWNELQELAIMYNLNEIPLYRSSDLREARKIAYRLYCNNELGQNLNRDFDYINSNDVVVPNKVAEEPKKESLKTKSESFVDNGF